MPARHGPPNRLEQIENNIAKVNLPGEPHPTTGKLNFGDCFAYALAKTNDAPLLYTGDDFRGTDVKSAV